MSCKIDPEQRKFALYALFRLHQILHKQERVRGEYKERGKKLSSATEKFFSRAIFAMCGSLIDCGHKKAALYYIRKRPKHLFSSRKGKAEILNRLEAAIESYLLAQQAYTRAPLQKTDERRAIAALNLYGVWKTALRYGLRKQAEEELLFSVLLLQFSMSVRREAPKKPSSYAFCVPRG